MFKTILLLLIMGIFVGCHKKETRQQLGQVKEIKTQRDSIERVYKKINKDFYKKIELDIYSSFDVFEKRDTAVPIPDSVYMADFGPYAGAGKGINRMFRKRVPGIEKELQLSENQLKNLRHDIAKGLISSSDSINIYISQEQAAIEKLIINVSAVETEFKRAHEVYNHKKVKVDSLVKMLTPQKQ